MKTDTKDVLKALVENRNIQNAMEALRKANSTKGKDYVSTFTVTIKQSGVEMALEEGNKKESVFQRNSNMPDRPMKKEIAALKLCLEPIIVAYIEDSYSGIDKEIIEKVREKVAKISAEGISSEIDLEVEKLWRGDKDEEK